MEKMQTRIIDFAVDHAILATVLMLLLTGVLGMFLPRAVVDTDPENMLEQQEPARVFHNQTKQRFELSDTVVLGIINEQDPDGVFNPATLSRVYALTEFAKTLRWPDPEDPATTRGVIEVDMLAPSLVDHMSQAGPGMIRFEWLMAEPPTTREQARAIRDKALSNPLLKDRMISADGKALCIYLSLTDKLLSYRVYTELTAKIAELAGDEEYHITGLPVAEGAIGVEMFTQMGTASPLAMAVIFGLLWLFFRRLVLVVLPIIIATVSVLATMGLLIGLGYPVHILSSMLPIFLMSISIVDSVHVLSEFFDVYTPEKGRRQTIKEVMQTLFVPILYTSLTTAAGFLSLVTTSIPPARIFGIFLSIGVMIAWLVTVVFVPAYIMLIPQRCLRNYGLLSQPIDSQKGLTKQLHALGNLTYRHAKGVVTGLVVVVAVAVWGITQIQINDNYAKRFTKSHPIRQADIALNQHFGGTYTAYLVLDGPAGDERPQQKVRQLHDDLALFARTHAGDFSGVVQLAERLQRELSTLASRSENLSAFYEAIVLAIDEAAEDASDAEFDTWQRLRDYVTHESEMLYTFKRPDVLNYMADFQVHMEQTGAVGKTQSVADVVRKVNQELIDGRPASFRIPETPQAVGECYMQFQQGHRPRDLWHLVTPDYRQTTIWMQFTTGDSKDMKAAVREVEAYFEKHPPPVTLTHRWAGLHYINRVLEHKLVWGFLRSFAGSFLVVFLMMSFLFRSAWWGLLCMLPLTITLVAIYGITGLVGKDYDLPIAVLSALSIGMAVDFAIHFLQRSRVTYRDKGSWLAAVPLLFGEPARAISRNMLVIAIGFLPLMTAPLVPYKTTGVMLFAILSLSGLITLLALPALLTLGQKYLFKSLNQRQEEQS